MTDARKAVDELLALVSDFISRGSGVMQWIVYSHQNVELMLEELRKAALEKVSP